MSGSRADSHELSSDSHESTPEGKCTIPSLLVVEGDPCVRSVVSKMSLVSGDNRITDPEARLSCLESSIIELRLSSHEGSIVLSNTNQQGDSPLLEMAELLSEPRRCCARETDCVVESKRFESIPSIHSVLSGFILP